MKPTKNYNIFRIRLQNDTRKRLTRSTEDLSLKNIDENNVISNSPHNGAQTQIEIERSPSCHVNVNRHSINLPKNFNPVSQLLALENLQIFLAKTFNIEVKEQTEAATFLENFDNLNGFTNKVFDTKIPKKPPMKKEKKCFKQITNENRAKDLRMLGILIMELIVPEKMRAFGSCKQMNVEQRVDVCESLLKNDLKSIPLFIQYPLQLLFRLVDSREAVTEKGLPFPNANQLLDPILCNTLFPFPIHYFKVYAVMKMLYKFTKIGNQIELFTFFECDGDHCQKFETLDKTRIAINRKLAECKVNSCGALIEGLLKLVGCEPFAPVQLLLPHIIELIKNEETSILSAWNLFDLVATALGPKDSQKFLLHALVSLYEIDDPNKVEIAQSNSIFRNKKSVKLYHHSFLLKLIVRFGLNCFLENFVPSIIEAVGGFKDNALKYKQYHSHQVFESGRSKNFKASESVSNTLQSQVQTDKRISPMDLQDDVFILDDTLIFDNTKNTAIKILDHFDTKSESGSIDLKLNYSTAYEVTEDEQIYDNLSCDSDSQDIVHAENGDHIVVVDDLPSKSVPIPFHRNLNSINCEVGSKKSVDSIDVFLQNMHKMKTDISISTTAHKVEASGSTIKSESRSSHSTRISEIASESLLWLSHRLGPVLTARYLTRNLLKMLTLCYIGHENLLPVNGDGDDDDEQHTLANFTITDSRVVGDKSALNVLDCLGSIAALFGEQFILLQYFPHISELIVLCKKKISPTLEGGLISSLQFLKYLIPFLTDTTTLQQLQDVILQNIIHPIIRLIGSRRTTMPSGFLARSVLARKLLDCIYTLSIRIGANLTTSQLCVPTIQRFFLIFDKAYAKKQEATDIGKQDLPKSIFNENNYVEIRRDGKITEWCVHGTRIQLGNQDTANENLDIEVIKEKAIDEICDVFTPNLAYVSYTSFLRYLGEAVMVNTVANLPLITSLCLEHEQPEYFKTERDKKFESTTITSPVDETNDTACSFGSNVAVGNRIDIQQDSDSVCIEDTIGLVAYKFESVNNSRHLKGNWLAYWEHEIGRADKDNRFNLKQIKLQSYSGHVSSVRSIICLDNENSFMSASKDKTVKLWSLRSEGDGSKISSPQFSYSKHKKSLTSLGFLESLR